MVKKRFVTMREVRGQAMLLAERFSNTRRLWGVPRGGIGAALTVNACLPEALYVDGPGQADLIIDDIWDSGATAARYHKQFPETRFEVLFDKRLPQWAGQWLVMPWEVSDVGSAEDIVVRLLQYIGEDPTREGLRETPARVLRAWKEWATGYGQDPATVLKTFEDGAAGCDELVIVHNVPVVSKCEHHLADIIGHAHVGYIPDGRIVGLSKLARLVEIFGRRLQVQERMTVAIADALVEHLAPLGVGVLIRASHACMSTRGVKIHGSVTTTSAMRGALLERGDARAEFMNLCAMAERDQ